MSDRLVPTLGISCALLTASYVSLVVITVFFAAWQSQAVYSVRNTESAIGNLEAKYYTTMNHVTQLNPATLGFVTPATVQYVAEARDASAGLSFNGN
jgi:L-lactate permease